MLCWLFWQYQNLSGFTARTYYDICTNVRLIQCAIAPRPLALLVLILQLIGKPSPITCMQKTDNSSWLLGVRYFVTSIIMVVANGALQWQSNLSWGKYLHQMCAQI